MGPYMARSVRIDNSAAGQGHLFNKSRAVEIFSRTEQEPAEGINLDMQANPAV